MESAATQLGNVTMTQTWDATMNNLLKVDPNAQRTFHVDLAPNDQKSWDKVEEVMVDVKHDTNSMGYLEVADNKCTLSTPRPELLSDGQDVGEDVAVFDYAKDGLGALSPTGSVYMVDKFDLEESRFSRQSKR